MNIYLLTRYGHDSDGETILDEVVGAFKTHELATEVMNKDIKRWHWSCYVNKDNYEIEEVELIEQAKFGLEEEE